MSGNSCEPVHRNTKGNLEDVYKSGQEIFEAMYQEMAASVQSLLKAASPDLGLAVLLHNLGVQTETSFA